METPRDQCRKEGCSGCSNCIYEPRPSLTRKGKSSSSSELARLKKRVAELEEIEKLKKRIKELGG